MQTIADLSGGVERACLASPVLPMLDLVSHTRLAAPDADLDLYSGLLERAAADDALARLVAEVPWRQDSISLWGKPFLQPRLSAWYGDAGSVYTYSGLTLAPLPWSPVLMSLRARVEQTAGSSFNSVLLNYYRDGQDSMGFHSDDEPELGPRPTIASLSLGGTRVFVLKHRRRADLAPLRIPLESGSLLLMGGDTQRCWKHGIHKQRVPCGARLNLTFRLIRHADAEARA